ncbi:MAG TPA: hypothetical protein VLH75_12690 [Longimicrobiales bacterium]|nr:hypothetical protein [Longimicrobiales bacterium]
MVPLLVITALLLLASGLVKVRAAGRVEMGVPILALAELLAGLGILGVAFVMDLTGLQGMLVLVGSVALVIVSSLQVGMEVRRRQRLRAASEGARLASYMKHLSRQDRPERP